MDDETALRLELAANKKVELASRAKDLLDNELLKQSFERLHDEYVAAWEITHINDTAGRERLFQAVQIVKKVESHLRKLIDGGKLATRDLADAKYLKR